MEFYIRLSFFACLFWAGSCQYHAQYRSGGPPPSSHGGPTLQPAAAAPVRLAYPEPPTRQAYDEPQRPRTPRPLILSHRQTQTHDGGFKYAFAADNGLQQGETISPDGTRTGAYSYVDPHGKQITVKYSAGKEGFRILEGPHKTPESAPHREPHQQYQQQQQQQQQPSYQQEQPSLGDYSSGPQTFTSSPREDEGRYTHAFHRGPHISSFTTAQPLLAPSPRYLSYKHAPSQQAEETSPSNNIIRQEPEYNDEPGKAYSFGNGYSFEFSG